MQLTKELERQARVLALAGDPTRIRILRLLADRPKVKVTDIAKEVGMRIACVSHHLQLLKDNKLVENERDGTVIRYQLAKDPFVKKLILLIK